MSAAASLTPFAGSTAGALAGALMVGLVAVPLAGAALSFLIGRHGALWVPVLGATLTLGCAAGLLAGLEPGEVVRYRLGGWTAPLGIAWQLDGLSVLLLTVAGGVALGVAVFSALAMPHALACRYAPPLLLLMAGLNALFLSADVFNLYVTLELTSLSAVALATMTGSGPAMISAFRYLMVAQAGSLSYLLGVGFLYGAFGTLDIGQLGERVEPGLPAAAAFALMTTGLFAKAALFPLHGWMPALQGTVAAPVSAMMSAVVELAFFYVLIRLWFAVFPAVAAPEVALLLAGLGAVAVLWGSLAALRQPRLRLLVAYSTVAQYGYLTFLLPLAATEAATLAWTGAVVLAASHAFAKAGMFLTAGAVLAEGRGDGLAMLNGIGRRLPIALAAFALCGLTLMGLPPSGGFAAKWMLAQAAIAAGQGWWAGVLLAGGLLAAGYVFLVLGRALAEETPADAVGGAPPGAAVGWGQQAVPLALALVSLALGAAAGPVAGLLTGLAPP